jgi:PKD repeat protein
MKHFWHTIYLFFFMAIALGINSYGQIHVSGSLCTNKATAAACLSPTLFFDLSTDSNIDSWKWDFGNGRIANTRNAQTAYPTAGKFTVKLDRFSNGSFVSSLSKEIVITDFNQPLLKGKEKSKYDDKCAGPIKLDPYDNGRTPPSGAKYKWFPEGETTRTIEVERSGCYSVEVTNAEGCSKIAQIEVDFCLGEPNSSSSKLVWYFGNQGGIEFGLKMPTDTNQNCDDPSKDCYLIGEPDQEPLGTEVNPITKGNKMTTRDAAAMIYNTAGALILYSNGKQIYDADDVVVTGGSSLSGSDDSPQSTVIVPKKTCNECPNHTYYVVTLNKTTGVLSYNLVDIRGAKQVVEQSITLATNMAGRISSTSTSDGYKIVSHQANNNVFKFFEIDSKGILETTQATGTSFSSAESNNGTTRISDLGTKMALALIEGGKNYIDLYDLTPTGGVSNYVRIDLGPVSLGEIYGLEFSPQDPPVAGSPAGTPADPPKYLYASVGNQIIQIDVLTKAKKTVYTDGSKIGALKLSPKQAGFPKSIVFIHAGSSGVGTIDFPETATPKPIGRSAQSKAPHNLALPEVTKPEPETAGAGITLTYKGRCLGSATSFVVKPMCADKGTAIYTWNFGDGKTFKSIKIPAAIHTYQTAGTYTLKLRINIVGCGEREYEANLVIEPSPIINTPGLVPVCDLLTNGVVSVPIDPKPTGGVAFTYKWVRGLGTNLGTNPTIIADRRDQYTVQIKNEKRCISSKEFEVKRICDPMLFVPDVFTPDKNNIDLNNDVLTFFPFFMTNVKVRIYNRWGEEVFAKDQPSSIPEIISYDQSNINILRELFWDGKHNGVPCPPGVYAYEIEFVEEFTTRKLTKTQKGSVLLIRE